MTSEDDGRHVTISVTQADIESGIPGTSGNCPIGLSLQQKFPEYDPVVGSQLIWLRGNCAPFMSWAATTPSAAADFMETFDQGETVEPIELDLVFRLRAERS